jgi:hypothetical protein
MSVASSEQHPEPTGHHRFGAPVPRSPLAMGLWFAAAVAVAMLIASPDKSSPDRVANSDSPHPFLTQVKVSVDPLTHWQPRSGQIRIILQSTGNTNLADSNLSVYFRWRTKTNTGEWLRTPNLHVVDLQNAQKLIVAAQVPDLPAAPWNGLPGWIYGNGIGVGEFLGLVPVAEVWIAARANGSASDAALADVVETIGVTNIWAASGAALGTVFVLAWFLKGVKPADLKGSNLLLQLIETRGRRASLSQFQIVLWMFVIGAATVYVMTLSGNLIPLTEGTLALLGISGVATLGSQFASRSKSDRTRALSAARRVAAPSWRDLIASDGEIDVTRLQMLFFTVLIAVFVSVHVIDSFQIPEIPPSFLGLMGLSNGVYLLSKFVPSMSEGNRAAGAADAAMVRGRSS